ncbi:MAG TPA: glycoside hydrolase domain-containing protein [Acidimicrobiales bacterium]
MEQGLDRAAPPLAPVAKAMLDRIGGSWWNVYIGGPRASVTWSPSHVAAYRAAGIGKFLLTYVGRQQRDVPRLNPAQGRADADDAARKVAAFGFGPGTPVCLDLELPTFEAAPSASLDYVGGWCVAVREQGLRPGVYANVRPLVALANRPERERPEWVWVARWSHRDFRPGAHPDQIDGMGTRWQGHRVWQYAGELDLGHLDPDFDRITIDLNVTTTGSGCLATVGGAAPIPSGTEEDDDMFTFTAPGKPVFFVAGGKAVGLNSPNDLQTIRQAVRDLPHFNLDLETFDQFVRTYRG